MPALITQKQYDETIEILRGNKHLEPTYRELKGWLKEEHNIIALNFYYEKIEYNNPENEWQLLILSESERDTNRIYDKKRNNKIAEKFQELALKYSFFNEENKNFCTWVGTYDFKNIMKQEVVDSVPQEFIKKLQEKYRDLNIWTIIKSYGLLFVFFYTDEEVKTNTQNGINIEMKEEFYCEITKYDEFHIFEPDKIYVVLDSKENLDKNYQGNFYYYFK